MGNILNGFKKLLSNKNTITIIGVLLGVVVLYFFYTMRVKEAVNLQNVPFATDKMVAGTIIDEGMIGTIQLPQKTIKKMNNLITNSNQLIGKVVSYNSKIAPNGLFFTENIISMEEKPKSIFSNIPDGYAVFILDIDKDKSYGNSIFPKDIIDLYISSNIQDASAISNNSKGILFGRFIKSIEVLAVRTSDGQDVFLDKDELGDPQKLLFAVPLDMYFLLQKAVAENVWDIIPVPRNASYTNKGAKTEIVNDEIEAMIKIKAYSFANN